MIKNTYDRLMDQEFMVDFYESNKHYLYYTAHKFTDSKADCDDIIQDVLVRLMHRIPTLRQLTKQQLATYLYLTVRSVYADRMKSAQSRTMSMSDSSLEALNAEDCSAEDACCEAKWDAEILRNALNSKDWHLLESKYILGQSDTEIACDIGCATNSVRTLLRRARKRAKGILKDHK